MPFHFKKAEQPAEAVPRICRRHIDEALGRLRKSAPPSSIHGVRKKIKTLRAILHLMRKEISRRDYRKVGKGLRRTAGRMAAPRDARVTLKALEKLAGRDAALRFAKIQKKLKKNHHRKTRRFRNHDSADAAKHVLKKLARRVGRLKIQPDGWTTIAPGLAQSYRLGRRDCGRARRQPTPENFHEWRKHVKTFWLQLQLLSPAWPARWRVKVNRLERLGELLGDDHDLFLLQQFAHRDGRLAGAKALDQLIESRRKQLSAAALKLGLRLYAEKPAIVRAQLENHLNAWRGETRRR